MVRIKPINIIIKGITFDLEGTLIDIEILHHKAHMQAAKDAGVDINLTYAYENLPHFVGGPDEAVARDFALLANRAFSTEEFLNAKRAYFNESLKNLTEIKARCGFEEILCWMHNKKLKTAIGTVTERSIAIKYLEKASLLRYFTDDMLVAKEDVDNPKPSPDAYIETARRMGINCTEQLIFEDSVVGIRAAVSANSRALAVPIVKKKSYVEQLFQVGAEAVFIDWTDSRIIPFMKRLVSY